MVDLMDSIAQNEYNGSLHAVYESWEFVEFVEKETGKKLSAGESTHDYKNLLPKFYRQNMESVKNVQKRCEENFVDCGYITDLSHSEKIYDFVLHTNTGSGLGLHIPNEFFAKGRYKPKEGDRISYIQDKKGNVTFSVRENGKDREIYSIDQKGEEYKNVIDAAKERRSAPSDFLAIKKDALDNASKGLSGKQKDLARLQEYSDLAILTRGRHHR